MTSEIIIIIIGAILVLLVVLDNTFFNKTSRITISEKSSIPTAIIGIILLFYGGFYYEAMNQVGGQIQRAELGNVKQASLPLNTVQILSPVQGDEVSCRILTKGVYPEFHNKDIWVLLKPSNNKYYPQSDHTNTSYKRNGEWQVITRFGGDPDEAFDVIVLETDASASMFFSNTIEQWKKQEFYPGLSLEEIPSGANAVDKITVSLRDNCRGVF